VAARRKRRAHIPRATTASRRTVRPAPRTIRSAHRAAPVRRPTTTGTAGVVTPRSTVVASSPGTCLERVPGRPDCHRHPRNSWTSPTSWTTPRGGNASTSSQDPLRSIAFGGPRGV